MQSVNNFKKGSNASIVMLSFCLLSKCILQKISSERFNFWSIMLLIEWSMSQKVAIVRQEVTIN